MKDKSKTGEEKEQKLPDIHFRQYAFIFKVLAVVCLAVAGLCAVLGVIIPAKGSPIPVILFFVGLAVLCVFFAIIYSLFYIRFDEEEIVYTGLFGRVKSCRYEDVTKVIINETEDYEIYVGKKKLLLADKRVRRSVFTKHNIPVEEKATIHAFEMWNPNAKIILWIMLPLGMLVMMLTFRDSLMTEDIKLFLLLGGMMIGGPFFVYWEMRSNRFVVEEETIIHYYLMFKVKKVKLTDVESMKNKEDSREQEGKVCLYYQRNGKRKQLEIPANYTNLHLLKKLARKYQWRNIR